ncbi:breast carcinoma amplified sequence 2-domain-containing protein [Nemania sp. FL0916]|nr:breast carcinoma amplified sequence 2-domain-containing protein [Nemania sp. FL0916]
MSQPSLNQTDDPVPNTTSTQQHSTEALQIMEAGNTENYSSYVAAQKRGDSDHQIPTSKPIIMASSIRTTVHESLPYVDQDPTPLERKAAEAQIASELSSSSSSPPSKPSQPTNTYTPTFTPLLTAELARISSGQPLAAIDLTRYEAQDPPPPFSTSPNTKPTDLTPALTRAYTSHTYLQHRQTHLHLLDAYGRNAWLVSNWQSESRLADLERELAAARREIDVLNIQRRRAQEHVGEEIRGLEETWKKGVGRVLETELATEELRQRVLEKQRGGG